jgi:hypothetical protein
MRARKDIIYRLAKRFKFRGLFYICGDKIFLVQPECSTSCMTWKVWIWVAADAYTGVDHD